MNIRELYDFLRKGRDSEVKSPTLRELGVTVNKVKRTDSWAKGEMYGVKLADILALASEEIDASLTATAIGDFLGNKIIEGDGRDIVGSIQSVSKPFLYLWALKKGASPHEISGIEANLLPYNADGSLRPGSQSHKEKHPLHNAGAISVAGTIKEYGSFDDFLSFMGDMTRNPNLGILEDVFKSEMKTKTQNKKFAYKLFESGRFKTPKTAYKALENYTMACSIGVTVQDLLYASLVLASGGIDVSNGKRLVSGDATIRVMNAMNTYGMYDETGGIALLVAGARANTGKSGVGGHTINVHPDVGAFATYNPLLDAAGNSVYGWHAMIPLNYLLASPGTVRLSIEGMEAELKEFVNKDAPKTHAKIMDLIERGFPPSTYKLRPEMVK